MPATEPPAPGARDAAARLATRLDRGVRRGWIERLVAVLVAGAAVGSACAAAVAASAAVQASAASPSGTADSLRRLAVWLPWVMLGLLATACGWWLARAVRSGRRRAPLDRLAVALATEADHPGLGERVSRAVGFLAVAAPGAGDAPAEDPLTAGLRRLAIDDAAAALDGVPVVSIPGATGRRQVIGAGLAVTVGAIAVLGVTGQRVGDSAAGCGARSVPTPAPGRAEAPRARGAAGPGKAGVQSAEAALETAARAVHELRAALLGDPELSAEQRARLAARAAAAGGAATEAARRDAAQTPPVMLAVYAAGLGDAAIRLDPRTPAAPDAPAAVAAARAVLDELATVDRARRRLPAAGAVVARLADVLWIAFGRGPGLDAGSLDAGGQEDLDRLAGIAANVRDAVAADARVLRAAVAARVEPTVAGPAIDLLEQCAGAAGGTGDQAVDAEPSAGLPALIAANRLARATRLARAGAGHLAAAVAALGLPPAAGRGSLDDGTGFAGRTAAGPAAPFARSTAALEAIAAAAAPPVDPTIPVIGGDAAAVARPPGTAEPSVLAAGGNTAVDPRGSAGAAVAGPGPPRSTEPAAGGSPPESLWTLLPPRARPDGFRRSAAPLDPAYDAAVDIYYRLLGQALQRHGGRPVEPAAGPPERSRPGSEPSPAPPADTP